MLTTFYRGRRGLLFKPSVLNRVAPLFFGPRLSRVIALTKVGLLAKELLIPLGHENWKSLTPEIRETLGQRVLHLCQKQKIQSLGVSRGLPPDSLGSLAAKRRGDNFIMALALLKIAESLGQTRGRRIILVSDQKLAFSLAVLVSERFKVPVFLQSTTPCRHEAFAWRMLYREGLAISLSAINPAQWKDDDIVLLLDEGYAHLVKGYESGWRLNLFDSSQGHAPQLEEELQEQGMDPALRNLAPLMEAYLLQEVNGHYKDCIKIIEEKGSKIWGYFLDKQEDGHYNTIKGF